MKRFDEIRERKIMMHASSLGVLIDLLNHYEVSRKEAKDIFKKHKKYSYKTLSSLYNGRYRSVLAEWNAQDIISFTAMLIVNKYGILSYDYTEEDK